MILKKLIKIILKQMNQLKTDEATNESEANKSTPEDGMKVNKQKMEM